MYIIAQMRQTSRAYFSDIMIAKLSDFFVDQQLARWQRLRGVDGLESAVFSADGIAARFVLVPCESYDSCGMTCRVMEFLEEHGVACLPALPPALDAMWNWPLSSHVSQYRAHGIEKEHFPPIGRVQVRIKTDQPGFAMNFIASPCWATSADTVSILAENLEGNPTPPIYLPAKMSDWMPVAIGYSMAPGLKITMVASR